MSNHVGAVIAALVDLGAVAEPVEQGLAVDLQIHDRVERPVELGQQRIERLGLADCSRETVEDKSPECIRVREAVPDDVDDQAVRGQLSTVEVGPYPDAERGAGFDLRPEDVARRDRRDPVFGSQHGRLGPLAGSWRPQEHEIERHAQYWHGKPIDSL